MVMPIHSTIPIWKDGQIECHEHIKTLHAGLHCDICDSRIDWDTIFYKVDFELTDRIKAKLDLCDYCCSVIALLVPIPKPISIQPWPGL